MKETLIKLEEFITHPDNEFITDKEREAFYIIAESINKFNNKYGWKEVNKMITIEEVKKANKKWFGNGNPKFFGDLSYSVFNNKEGEVYLIRLTTMWSDMFNGVKKKFYRINKIDKKTLKIGDLYDNVFNTLEESKNFLK